MLVPPPPPQRPPRGSESLPRDPKIVDLFSLTAADMDLFPLPLVFVPPTQDDVDNNAPGRMKAVMQTTPWFVWLESVEEEEDEED